MEANTTTRLPDLKVLPRLRCHVCGDYGSETEVPSTTIDLHITEGGGTVRLKPIRFRQCRNCDSKLGFVLNVFRYPHKSDVARFVKAPKELVNLAVTIDNEE